MSYILDSLKKSDKERRQADGVSEHAFKIDPIFLDQPKIANKTMLAVLLIMIIVLFFVWKMEVFSTNENKMGVEIHVVSNEQQVTTNPIPDVVIESPVVERKEVGNVSFNRELSSFESNRVEIQQRKEMPGSSLDTNIEDLYRVGRNDNRVDHHSDGNVEVDNKIETDKASLEVVEDTSGFSIQSIYDVKRSIQSTIPAIDYGAHVYATGSNNGFVILNGAKRKAGEKTRGGVYIERVEEDAVILSYRGIVFSLPAMTSWNP